MPMTNWSLRQGFCEGHESTGVDLHGQILFLSLCVLAGPWLNKYQPDYGDGAVVPYMKLTEEGGYHHIN